MANNATYAPWPGRSDVAWSAAEALSTSPSSRPEQRRVAPDIATLDGFRRHVRTPFSEGFLLCAVLGGLTGALLLIYAVGPASVHVRNPTLAAVIRYGAIVALVISLIGCVCGAPVSPLSSRLAHARMRARPHILGHVYPAKSRTGTWRFRVEAGEGLQDTAVVIDTVLEADSAARLLEAFDVWFETLENDRLADRGAQLRFGSATIVATSDIFGPEATGGYLVRDEHPDRGGWRLLISARPLPSTRNVFRSGEVLTVTESPAAIPSPTPGTHRSDTSGHLIERAANGLLLGAAVVVCLWWFGWLTVSIPW